jgi:hypothetical protein
VPDRVAGREAVSTGLDDLAHGHDAIHWAAKRGGLEVARGSALAQAQPHPGVHGRERVAYKDPAEIRLRNLRRHDPEVRGLHLTLWVLDELDLATRASRHASMSGIEFTSGM